MCLRFTYPLLLVVAVVLVFLPGVDGDFVFDDFPNIVNNLGLQQTAREISSFDAIQSHVAHSSRPLATLTFAANFAFGSGSAGEFKAVNILIHALNAVLVFLLTRLLLARLTSFDIRYARALAFLVAGAWALHPITLTSVLYVVQRMNSLSAMFVLSGFILWLLTEKRLNAMWLRMSVVALFTTLAWSCKENGALLPVFIILYEFVRGRLSARWLTAASALLLIAGAAWIGYFGYVDNIVAAYEVRPWGLFERVLTQARAVAAYLGWILIPDISELGLYHDDFAISRGFLDPWTTLPATLLHPVLLFFGIRLRHRAPLFAFGLLFFYAGHLLESTVIPLELVHEHRNYLPQLGVWMSIAGALAAWRRETRLRELVTLGVALIVTFGLATAVRASTWKSGPLHIWIEVMHHPGSSRALNEMGGVFRRAAANVDDEALRQDFLQRALMLFDRSDELDSANFSGAFGRLYVQGPSPMEKDVEFLQALTERMLAEPYFPNNENLFYQLAVCSKQDRCRYGADNIQRFLESQVDHPTAPSKYRAGAATVAAMHAHEVLEDDGRSEALLRRFLPQIFRQDRLCVLYEFLRQDMAADASQATSLPSCGEHDVNYNERHE